MTNPKKLYVPDVIVRWPAEMYKLKPDGVKAADTYGFLPAFESLELLRKHYPDADYKTIDVAGEIHGENEEGIMPGNY